MNEHFFSEQDFRNLDAASQHFAQHDGFMSVLPGSRGFFHYSKRICMLGESFVSTSTSRTGWGYETKNEIDGFLISIPLSGEFHWTNSLGSFEAKPGSIVLLEQRMTKSASYSEGMIWAMAFISYNDLFRALILLLGRTPKTRLLFKLENSNQRASNAIRLIIQTILQVASNTQPPITHVTAHLKDALINLILYNFNNNYSSILLDNSTITTPTPYVINNAAAFMESSNSPALTVNDVAIHAGLSVRSLQLGFKKYKNMTPIAFLRMTRLKAARQLLKTSTHEITPQSIATQCGFSNYYLFKKYYLETYSETPNETKLKYQQATKNVGADFLRDLI